MLISQKMHFNIFAGNPVSCAAGKAVLETIERERIQENCNAVDLYLSDGLKQQQSQCKAIGDVRGLGLMLGVEVVKDRETKEPNPQRPAKIHELSKIVLPSDDNRTLETFSKN